MTGANDSRLVGLVLDKYRIDRELYSNNRHTVLEVVDVSYPDEHLIMKVAPSHHKASLGAEAAILKKIRYNPHVRGLIDEQLDGDVPYIVLEHAGDETARTLLQREGKVPYGKWVQIVKQVFLGLDHIHSRGVIHHDIKPENIFIEADGHVKIADFDLAKEYGDKNVISLDDNLQPVQNTVPLEDLIHISDVCKTGSDSGSSTVSKIIAGTRAYMAPEKEKGNATPQSDIYSLGVTAYEMLMGKHPARHFTKIPSRQGHPKWTDEFFYITLEEDLSKRFDSAKAALRFIDDNIESKVKPKSNKFEVFAPNQDLNSYFSNMIIGAFTGFASVVGCATLAEMNGYYGVFDNLREHAYTLAVIIPAFAFILGRMSKTS